MPAANSSLPSVALAAARLRRTGAVIDDISRLRYVKGERAKTLERLGINSVRDLLLHIPRRYLDFSHQVSIAYADVGKDATVICKVETVRTKRPKPRMVIVEVELSDHTGVMVASFFKQPWIAEQLHPGDIVAISGRVRFAYGFKQITPSFYEKLEVAGQNASYSRVLPVHPVGEGISPAWMRRIMSAALADAGDIADFLPAQLVSELGLMSESRALNEVHFPQSLESAEQARRRLAYDELLCLQLALQTRRRLSSGTDPATAHVINGPVLTRLRAALPFALSNEQEQAVSEILSDMAAAAPMNRLLLGDVGTGKTAVASLALAAVADTGSQAAVMAPTSVLARQYAEILGPLLDAAGISWTLILGSTPADERARAVAGLAAGSIQVAFGTTALLSDDVMFGRLSLVVIDEQHRFGVDQRAALRRKGSSPDLLAMTATPIPRTLALSLYGDLDCSRIVHRPVEGAGVSTQSIVPKLINEVWGAIEEAVAAGHQAYVICPLIDDSDTGADLDDDAPELDGEQHLHAATTTAEHLAKSVFPQLRVGLLTGRMSADEKDRVMDAFRSQQIDVLVSTTVVEVGVDVPNATVMLIHDADRFGLATLHQLRGRVGRGKDAGVVYVESSAAKGSTARKRLDALERISDGAELAELDLKLRREGELLGYKQHGESLLKLTDLSSDRDLIEAAHRDARRIFHKDPELTSELMRPLAFEIVDRFGAYFEELTR